MSRLDRLGHAPDAAAVADCLQRLADAPAVRFVFPDLHGLFRGKMLIGDPVASAFRNGIGAPVTLLLKDTSGLTAFPVWAEDGAPVQGVGDLIMVPDPTSLIFDATGTGVVTCDVIHPDGRPIPFAPRHILRNAVQSLAAHGLTLHVGLELEFHVFDGTPDSGLAALSSPQQLLSQQSAIDNAPLLDAIRAACSAAHLPLATLETEHGASQFEATFDVGLPEQQADIAARFRELVKATARALGYHATFMCKPPAPATAASGWHIHQSLWDDTGNLFDGDDPRAAHWIGGLLRHGASACLLTNPTVNAYRRFAPNSMAPDRIAWGHDTRGAMIRAISDGAASRVENRAPEPAANPWLALAAQIHSGLSGLRDQAEPPAPVTTPYAAQAPTLPACLGDAIHAFTSDSLWSEMLGQDTANVLAQVARSTWRRYLSETDRWDNSEYLDLF